MTSLRSVGFRAWFAFAILYYFPFPIGALPFTKAISDGYDKAWGAVVSRVGASILHLEQPVQVEFNGSGDRTADWIQLGLTIGLALLAAIVGSIAVRRRETSRVDDKLRAGLRVYLRYALCFILVGYGFAKVWRGQFPPPSPERLLEPYGQSSPMGLLWTFMGFSAGYSVFAGLLEIVAGGLLVFRRTVTLGALVAAAVLGNVVMLNLCYDVPVKLYSSTLLVTSLWLASPDAKRLVDFFLLHRPTTSTYEPLELPTKTQRRARIVAKAAVLLFGVYGSLDNFVQAPFSQPPTHPFAGFYEVESLRRGGVEIPALVTEKGRWHRVVVNRNGLLSAQMTDAALERYMLAETDEAKKAVVFKGRRGTSTLSFSRPDEERLTLTGELDGEATEIELHRVEPPKSPLESRGFHWVNEFPLNR